MNIVGPSQMGAADVRSFAGRTPEKDLSNSGKESFGKALEEKMSGEKNPDKMSTKQPLTEDRGVKKPEIQKKDAERSERAEKPSKEDQSEKLEAKPDKKVALKQKPEEKTQGDPSRQQAIKEFMDSFESEFQIPPTRLVDAMAQLKDEELQMSPEETASRVIEDLDLDPEDNERAQAMYVGLLAQLQQLDTPAEAPKATVLPNQQQLIQPQANHTRSQVALQQQSAKDATVDRVNSKFWMKDQGRDQMLSQRLTVDEQSFGRMAPETNNLDQAQSAPDALAALPPHLRGQMSESISPQLLAALAAKQAASAQVQGSEVRPEDMPAEDAVEDQQATSAPAVMGAENMTAESGQVSMENMLAQDSGEYSQQQFGQGADSGAFQAQAKATGATGKEAAQEKLTAKAGEFKSTLTGLEGLHQQPIKGEALTTQSLAVPVAAQAPVQTQADHEATVKNLMNQAQYLVKKGGGEVKVEMTPEGMGTIHLKLQVQDGKVNVHMAADTAEAKKTIESGLAELKTSLAAHKLSVDHVKVDVVNNASPTDTGLQNQTNQNGQREGTRQFWNQFNENFGSQGRREGYTQEGVNLRGYGRSQAHDPLKPIETKAKTRAVDGKGSGLNLVA